MKSMGWVDISIKGGSVGKNVIGALIFGVGFAVLGYSPGTIADAFGNGYMDAMTGGVVGVVLGTWIFAVVYQRLKDGILKKGEFGEITLPELFKVNDWVIIPTVVRIVLLLIWIEILGF